MRSEIQLMIEAEKRRALEAARRAAEVARRHHLNFVHARRASMLTGRTILHRHDVDTEREGIELLHVLAYERKGDLACSLHVHRCTPLAWRWREMRRLAGLWRPAVLDVNDNTFEDAMCTCADLQAGNCELCSLPTSQDRKWNWCLVAREDAPQRGVRLTLKTI